MITVTFSGDSSAEVHQQILEFGKTPNVGSTEPKKIKKTEEADPIEEAPKRKTSAPKTDDEPALEDANLREALQANDWPIEQAKAFINKFGYDSIVQIPVKKRKEFVELVEEAGTWSAKKLSAYLTADEL